MSLTPQDIQAKQFHVRFRGFDVEEVDGFLEQVAENFLMLMEENKAIQLKADAFELELEEIKKEEHSFKNAMISAQSVADGMLKKSREDADYLLAQTHDEIKKHKDNAIEEITELELTVDQLRGTQAELQKDLRAVLDDYLDMIDNTSTTLDSDEEPVDQEDVMPMATSSALSDADVDLSDLYEKIELPAEHPAVEDSVENKTDEVSIEPIKMSESEADDNEVYDLETESNLTETSIPDLDDEIMFTLDDPLDDVKVDESKS